MMPEAWRPTPRVRQHRSVDRRRCKIQSRITSIKNAMRAVLASMPGIGFMTVEVILAELGDWHRFRNADAVVSFAGLDPGVQNGDGKGHALKLSKSGSPLLR